VRDEIEAHFDTLLAAGPLDLFLEPTSEAGTKWFQVSMLVLLLGHRRWLPPLQDPIDADCRPTSASGIVAV
jgi:hypothetical protein